MTLRQDPKTGWLYGAGDDDYYHHETRLKIDRLLRSTKNGPYDRQAVITAAYAVLIELGGRNIVNQILGAKHRRGRPRKGVINRIELMRHSHRPELRYLAEVIKPRKWPIKTGTDQYWIYRLVQYWIDMGESENDAIKLVTLHRQREGLIQGTKGDRLNIRKAYLREKARR